MSDDSKARPRIANRRSFLNTWFESMNSADLPKLEDSSPDSAAQNVEELLAQLEKASLLSDEQLEHVRQRLQGIADLHAATEELVRTELLTQWQASELTAGRSDLRIGEYTLLDCLGRGAGGTVYKVRDPEGQVFALKVLSKELAVNADHLARFLREGRVAATMKHPHIVPVFASSQDGDRHYLVMEYVPGRDLGSWVAEVGPLPIEWTCECIRQAAIALAYAHYHGIVHRDVKPDNLLIAAKDFNEFPQAKLLDLGVASANKRDLKGATLTKVNQLIGTPDFMAPEQAETPNRVDRRADIYSLGCTLFFCLTAEVPFEGKTAVAKLTARFRADAPPIRTFRSDVPAELEAVIAKMTTRDLAIRYQSCQEVAKALLPFSLSTGEDMEDLPPLPEEPQSAAAEAPIPPASGGLSIAPLVVGMLSALLAAGVYFVSPVAGAGILAVGLLASGALWLRSRSA